MSILVATPCYGGQVTTHYLKSALDTQRAMLEAGMPHDWLFGWNESLVQRARNKLVRAFLETDYRKLLFIDADIQWRPEHVAALWNLQDSASITVGAYPMKKPGAPVAAWLDDGPADLDTLAGPTPVTYAGTGFMMIDRGVFEALKSPEIEHEESEGRTWAFFDCHIRNDCYLSEDYWFCRTARAAGFEILLDPSIRLVHWGSFGYGAGLLIDRRPMHERLGIGNRDLPDVPQHSGRCYVVGSGRCVWDDLKAAGWHIDTRAKVLTVNDVTMHMPGPVHMAYSNDHHWLPKWVEARRPHYVKQWGKPGQHTCGNGMSPLQTIWPWPGHGSSGLNAVYTALALGFDEILVCGVPLDDSGHYFDPPWVRTNFTNECRDHNRGGPKWWREAARNVFDGKVRVMSGRIADWMAAGSPVT